MKPFKHNITPENIGELIDLSVQGDAGTESMAQLQLEGIAALYNILCTHDFAYLADELGMGKTYQALGLAAILWNENPGARILFICPRENLQVKWRSDYLRFFSSNYRRAQGLGDDRATSILFKQPIHRPETFRNLRAWCATIGLPQQIAPFIRHTSFTRPVYVTSEHLSDIDVLLQRTKAICHSCGLFNTRMPNRRVLTGENGSREVNLAFAKALNTKLTEEAENEPYFDLVIVDEAQCLRNPNNQTNDVLYHVLKDQVKKWLLVSATPAHGGPGDLPTILNHYPNRGKVLEPSLVDDLDSMQSELQKYLIRRPRKYSVRSTGTSVKKDVYRSHDAERWAITDASMSALETLAIGLVQKYLTVKLEDQGNRFKIGFLSSFESLQSSLLGNQATHSEVTDGVEVLEDDSHSDYERRATDRIRETKAPDAEFVHKISTSFEENFGIPLPHPKVDFVVDRVAELAFGAPHVVGGCKFLIFTRRISTVEAIRSRLMRKYHESIVARIQRCWGETLDWSGEKAAKEEMDTTGTDESIVEESTDDLFRHAMSEGKWLYRFRQTFRRSGRNSLFFEDAWFQRLCVAGGVEVKEAADRIPKELWAESRAHAARTSGRVQYRARLIRYLSLHAILRVPHVFGFDEESARAWQIAYESMLHDQINVESADIEPTASAIELLTHPTLWTQWDACFPTGPLALPAGGEQLVQQPTDIESLYRRQVLRTLLGQTFQLTDTLLDVYFANEQSGRDATTLPERFMEWFLSDDVSAYQLREECANWIKHTRLIVDSCLDGAGKSWQELASTEDWPPLYNLKAVMGVVGGSGDQKSVTAQFRTPSLPRIVVCTDTLKEGVDMHLFCDQVLHYGVAWTSGDLEQRIGRVDRFFSKIERRLQDEGSPPDVTLDVGYPHVVASLEHTQVERVRERQKLAEKLMDSPISVTIENEEESSTVEGSQGGSELTGEPYANKVSQFPDAGRNLVVLSAREANNIAEHYRAWYAEFMKMLLDSKFQVSPKDENLVQFGYLNSTGFQYEFVWSYDATIGRYVITVSDVSQCCFGRQLQSKRRRLKDREYQCETFVRVLIPTPDEGLDTKVVSKMLNFLDGETPQADLLVEERWQESLASVAGADPSSVIDEDFTVVRLPNRSREQAISLRVQTEVVRICSLIAPLELLPPRSEWNFRSIHDNVQAWALNATNDLSLGYLTVNSNDELVYGMDVICGNLPATSREQVIHEAAWRADMWEAALTGEDRW